VGQWLMWKQVTDAEREQAGVHNKKERRPEIPRPPPYRSSAPKRATPGRSSSPTGTGAVRTAANPRTCTASKYAGPSWTTLPPASTN
jgi:hypothetical protein